MTTFNEMVVDDLQHVSVFFVPESRFLQSRYTRKLLKVALNTIILTPNTKLYSVMKKYTSFSFAKWILILHLKLSIYIRLGLYATLLGFIIFNKLIPVKCNFECIIYLNRIGYIHKRHF
jgi:hypothetical protein